MVVGSFITRALILVLGYAYPAYDCYKTVELNRPEIEQLRFWCQYWILLAMLTVFERIGDNFISWLPMYSEAKLAFIVYLWYPKTQGTSYVYESFFKPYIAKHESEIDRNLLELRTRASDMAVIYFHKVADYSQSRFHEILQYIASQSQGSRPQAQQQQQRPPPPRTRMANPAPPPVPAPTAPPMPPQPAQVPPTPPRMQVQDKGPVPVAPPGAVPPVQQQTPSGPGPVAGNSPPNSEDMLVDQAGPSTSNMPPPRPTMPEDEETLIHEAIRLTRGRLRRRMGGSGPPSN
ncbi:putative HVA22-like protein g [Hordeum vulgare]|uniref:HVA22-like protein n=1 Tax=Hordeum vulgare subsp. vulgare TaxID=112509 RepID=F2D9N8_HORVV|nr:putative HVA22-like protein g [Hordeum vulgare subsp. vulgare]KAE8768103.1 putative HVA22-like protein g [Hordeum vulgare]BAJ91809.1 predicted protein [Hordeum vulgare subsp. vulgare]BAJ99362.1 predicted protein [Hordeum vulgare subsp. vulgare]